jgi:hypothetical protein
MDAYQLVAQIALSPVANVCDTVCTMVCKVPKAMLGPVEAFAGKAPATAPDDDHGAATFGRPANQAAPSPLSLTPSMRSQSGCEATMSTPCRYCKVALVRSFVSEMDHMR